jgi:hypothetical protein
MEEDGRIILKRTQAMKVLPMISSMDSRGMWLNAASSVV